MLRNCDFDNEHPVDDSAMLCEQTTCETIVLGIVIKTQREIDKERERKKERELYHVTVAQAPRRNLN